MNAFANQKSGYSMAWAPARPKSLPPPTRMGAGLGQTTGGDSPLVLTFADTMVAGSAGLLAWSLHTQRSSWSTFWWVVAGIAFVKGLHDASKL